MLNFDFLDKDLGIVSPAQQKCSSCYILLTDQISLPGCLYFLRYWVTCVLQLFVNQVVNFDINLIFLIESLFLHDKKVMKKLKYLEHEKSI